MALWEGNDVNIELYEMSGAAARFWSAIMSRVCEPLPTESFRSMPSNVKKINGEYYTDGTYSRVKRYKDKEDNDKDKTEKKVTKSTTTKAPTTKKPTNAPTTQKTTEAPPPTETHTEAPPETHTDPPPPSSEDSGDEGE